MGAPIDRTAKNAMDLNLVNGVASDAPKLKASDNVLYDYVDGLNSAQDAHAQAATLAHPDGSVKTAKIADGAVTTAKLADKSVTTAKIADAAVGAAQLATSGTVNESVNNVLITALKADVTQRAINPMYPPAPLVAAIGDASTDDTAAIQAIIDSLTNGGVIVLTKRFKVTTVTLKSNIAIIGTGQRTTGFVATGTNTVINVPDATISWMLSNFGIFGNGTGTGINLAGTTGVADFSIRDVFINNCLVGLQSAFAWAFSVDRVRFQGCPTSLILNSQTNQGSFTDCSFKTNKKVVGITNCNAINFIGCEFAGSSHDGTVPVTIFQSAGINFIGNYTELFANNSIFATIGALSQVTSCLGISFKGNRFSHTTSGRLFDVYECDGLEISNNGIYGSVAYLLHDQIGNIHGLNMKGNSGFPIEYNPKNIMPNYGFFSWPSGTSSFPANFTAVSSTGSRGVDGSLEMVTAGGLQGFFSTMDELNLTYISYEIEVKSSVDNVLFLEPFINGAYGATRSITLTAGVYKKVSFIVYVNASTMTFFRGRFQTAGTHNVKTLRLYRGVLDVNDEKEVNYISSSAPTHNTFLRDDVVYNPTPTLGGIKEWKCITAGSPGTHTPVQLGALTSIAATPAAVGLFAVSGSLGYMSVGTSSSADWKQITN